MAKPEKVTAVAEIASRFTESSAAVLTEYRGLTVAQLTEVRRALGPGNSYAVVKNTLTRRAARDAGLDQLDELLTGPTAIAFITGDPVAPTKGLRDFSQAHPMLVIKGGVLDGRPISPAEIATIADLDSREVLLAKLAVAMKGNLTKAAGLFQAPLAQLARLGAALVDKRTAAETLPAETPAAETPAATESSDTPAATQSTA
ncbi:MAG: 50S ribosomal protein L10 [Geodermatophilaceae bacterium]